MLTSITLILSNDEVYSITIFLTRISILLLYCRLFGIYRASRRLVYIGVVLCSLDMTLYLGIAIARSYKCITMKALVTPLCSTKTVSTTVATFGNINAFTDFCTLLI